MLAPEQRITTGCFRGSSAAADPRAVARRSAATAPRASGRGPMDGRRQEASRAAAWVLLNLRIKARRRRWSRSR